MNSAPSSVFSEHVESFTPVSAIGAKAIAWRLNIECECSAGGRSMFDIHWLSLIGSLLDGYAAVMSNPWYNVRIEGTCNSSVSSFWSFDDWVFLSKICKFRFCRQCTFTWASHRYWCSRYHGFFGHTKEVRLICSWIHNELMTMILNLNFFYQISPKLRSWRCFPLTPSQLS